MRTIIFGCLLLSVVATGCAEVPPAVPSESEAQAVVFNAAGAPTVEIDVPGLHCENCSATACTLLADVPGVVEVKADATTKKAIIAVDQSTFDTEAARSRARRAVWRGHHRRRPGIDRSRVAGRQLLGNSIGRASIAVMAHSLDSEWAIAAFCLIVAKGPLLRPIKQSDGEHDDRRHGEHKISRPGGGSQE